MFHCAYLVSYSLQVNFPGWGWVAGLVENEANSFCSAELKLELDWAWQKWSKYHKTDFEWEVLFDSFAQMVGPPKPKFEKQMNLFSSDLRNFAKLRSSPNSI